MIGATDVRTACPIDLSRRILGGIEDIGHGPVAAWSLSWLLCSVAVWIHPTEVRGGISSPGKQPHGE